MYLPFISRFMSDLLLIACTCWSFDSSFHGLRTSREPKPKHKTKPETSAKSRSDSCGLIFAYDDDSLHVRLKPKALGRRTGSSIEVRGSVNNNGSDRGRDGRKRDGQVPIVSAAREVAGRRVALCTGKFIPSIRGNKRNLHQYYQLIISSGIAQFKGSIAKRG